MAKTETKTAKTETKTAKTQEIKTHYAVKNKVTGYTYKLPKEDVDRLVVDEPHNFEVIDKDYVKPVTEIADKTVYTQIIEDEQGVQG